MPVHRCVARLVRSLTPTHHASSLQTAMYFPSPLPTTRLSISTSEVPVGPSPSAKTSVYKTPGRPSKGKFKDSLGGVQEEEGEEILSIVRGPEVGDGENAGASPQTLWVALGREEVSVWSIRVRFLPLSRALCAS